MLDMLACHFYSLPMPAATKSPAAPLTAKQQDAADKRAKRKAAREMVAAHNERVFAARAAVAAHEAVWGEDGYECA